jgi:multiple sugar transport system permease protein
MSKVQEQERIQDPVTPGHDIVESPRGSLLPRHWTRVLYIAPLLIILLSLVVFPIFYALRYSFYDYYLTRGIMRFVGLQNYVDASRDTVFLQAAWVNVRIIVASLIAEFSLGLLFALAAHSVVRGRALIVALLTVPIMVSTSAAGMAFRMIMLPEYGPLNYIIGRLIGRDWVAIDWFGDPQWAVWSLVIASVWHAMPFVMLILLAGLVSINQELFEAAKIDGAGYWTILRDISLPMLRGPLMVAFLLRLIELIKMFDLVYLLTQGGPARVTETMSFYVYYVGLRFFRVGYGVTLSLVMLVITLILAFTLTRVISRMEVGR